MTGPRFLVVKFSAIGDCVLAVPVASRIRCGIPDAFIAWAVDPRCAGVIDVERLVDVRYEIPRETWKTNKVSWVRQIRHFARLRSFRFDYGLDLQGHSKTAICLRLARPKKSLAVRATDIASRLINPIAEGRLDGQHVIERNLEVLDQLGDFKGDSAPIMPSPEPHRAKLIALLGSFENLATLSVSAGHPSKCYAAEGWAHVARLLLQRGFRVALLGGPGDPHLNVPGAVDFTEKLSLAETAAAVALSRIHLAADTGTGHIAAAYGVPVVSVFGYTKATSFRPYTDKSVVLDAGTAMNRVSPEQICTAAETLLERKVDAVPS